MAVLARIGAFARRARRAGAVAALKRAHEETQRVQERLELALRGSQMSIWDFQVDGGALEPSRLTYSNALGPRGRGIPLPTSFEGALRALVAPEDREQAIAACEACFRGETPEVEIEYRSLGHDDGLVHWRLSRGRLMRDANGIPIRFLGTSVDITDLKRAEHEARRNKERLELTIVEMKQIEQELLRAREAAESANRAKDEFLANVSHEIRTPMNAILGMTELAIDASETVHQRQLLSTVKSAASNLLGIINDLLDFSKIAAGKLTFDDAEFSLRTVLGDTLRALATRAHRKGLELASHVHPEVPDAIRGDAGRLRQVLLNLVGNAIKFTPQGKVSVDVAVVTPPRVDDDGVSLLFTVRDTGIGIAVDKHAAIFRAFEQEDASTTRKYGGTGLGLTISAQLAALMGGEITVESELGQGSTFRFSARFARSSSPESPAHGFPDAIEEAPIPDAMPGGQGALHVLVAEDNELNVALLQELMSLRGHSARFASDGCAALVLSAQGGFDVLLLDLHMPEMNGLEVTAAIRERERTTGHHLPIVALTARSSMSDRDRALAAGMDAFLSKPIEIDALWATIARMVTRFPRGRA